MYRFGDYTVLVEPCGDCLSRVLEFLGEGLRLSDLGI